MGTTLNALDAAGVTVEEHLTEINCGGRRNQAIEYIVLHYVGATGGAMANAHYYHAPYRGASAHYFVDFDGSVVQVVPDDKVAWHCGTRGVYTHPKCRNSNSIGIEMCVRNSTGQTQRTDRDAGWYFEAPTVPTAQLLTATLARQYGIPPDRILRHFDVTGKCCPAPYCNGQLDWNDFLAGVSSPHTPLPVTPTSSPSEPPPISSAQFARLMEEYLDTLSASDYSPWAKTACQWAFHSDLIRGDTRGRTGWRRFVTLEQLAVVLQRLGQENKSGGTL